VIWLSGAVPVDSSCNKFLKNVIRMTRWCIRYDQQEADD
jgi:hypothetical protein